jgi:hypothetical protein
LDRFQTLSQWLSHYQTIWRVSPFIESASTTPSWADQFPQIWAEITSLTQQQIIECKSDDNALLSHLRDVEPGINSFEEFIDVPVSDSDPLKVISETLCVGMPGNKRQQIEHFLTLLPAATKREQWLEWCAGKGYLGRAIAKLHNQPVVSLEWQKSLVDAGQAFSDAHQLGMEFYQQDVFDNASTKLHMHPQQHCVALHACGDLHIELIKRGIESHSRSLTIAPCCFHLTRDERYHPLSALGREYDVKLSQSELRIPLQQTVTGGERVVRHRQLEMQFRLGFDELLRTELSFKTQTSVPSIKKSLLEFGFEHFCHWAATKKELQLAKNIDFDYYRQKGTDRFWHMERLSLAQQLFQRPIEIWLALDKCQFLAECGYEVTLSQFCTRSLTPRNLVIQAVRP